MGAALAALVVGGCRPQASAPATRPEAPVASMPMAGQVAPEFTLVDAEGVRRSLADFRGKTVVLEWTDESCPYVRKHYAGAMQALQREAAADGAAWIAIVSSAAGTPGRLEGETARGWRERNEAGPVHLLLDPTGWVGHLYGVTTTPEMRVIDAQGILTYVGGVDDRPTLAVGDLQGATHFVRAALEDMSIRRPVRTAFAARYGCPVKHPPPAGAGPRPPAAEEP